MNILNIFSEKIEKILEDKDVNTILIIGSGSIISENDLDKIRDIDLLVTIERDAEFEREVGNYRGVEFDISYISMKDLRTELEQERTFLVTALNQYRFVYKKNNKIDPLLNYAKELYLRGPYENRINKKNKDFIRFMLYQQFGELGIGKKDEVNLAFLTNQFFSNILVAYYRLNNLWTPKDKKLINNIMKTNEALYNKAVLFQRSSDILHRIEILQDMMEYVLEPFGGVLKEWEKGSFPLD